MITTARKAQVIRNAILSRLRAVDMAGEYDLTGDEATFLWDHIKGVDAVIARIVAAVDEGAAGVADGVDATPRLKPGR